jgi:uncharacterized spore protein YtfJ
MDLNDLVKGLLSELNKVSKSDAVVGTVRDAGKAKVLPLSKVSIGFGSGVAEIGGKSQAQNGAGDVGAQGGGVGGALTVEPKAFVIVGEDGVPRMLALKRGRALVRQGVEILPDGRTKPALGEAKVPKLAGKKSDKGE